MAVRTVVVTGSAGPLGQRVVKALAGRDEVGRVVAVDVAAQGPSAGAVECHRVDLAALPVGADPFPAVVGEADAVIHLAWAPDAGEANLRALSVVLAASAGAGGLVHVSSASVYGAWPDNPVPLTEDVPVRPNSGFVFAAEKAEAERVMAEWADAHPSVAVSVLRPCAVVGSTGPPLYRALAATRPPGGGEETRPVQFLHVDDLASAVVTAWEKKLTGTFNVAPDGGTTTATATAIVGGLGRLPLPAPVRAAASRWAWRLARSGLPREAAAYGRYPWVVAADRLRAAGWQPRYTSEEALVASDQRLHWDDLPPGRLQEFTLLLGAGAGLAAAAAAGAVVLALRRRAARG